MTTDDEIKLTKMITMGHMGIWTYKDDIALHAVRKIQKHLNDDLSSEKGIISMLRDVIVNELPNILVVDREDDNADESLLLLLVESLIGNEPYKVLDNIQYYDNHNVMANDEGIFRLSSDDTTKSVIDTIDATFEEYSHINDMSYIVRQICDSIQYNNSFVKMRGNNALFRINNASSITGISDQEGIERFKGMVDYFQSRKWKLVSTIKQPFIFIPKSFYEKYSVQIERAFPDLMVYCDHTDIPEQFQSNFTEAMIANFIRNDQLYILPIESIKDINRFSLLSGTSSNNKRILTCINYDFILSLVDT